MAASRINSTTRLCFKYRFIFFAALIILSLQLLLAYNFNVFVKRQPDKNQNSNKESSSRLNLSSQTSQIVELCSETSTSKEASHALARIKTAECKSKVVTAVCLNAQGKLFPKKIRQDCPIRMLNSTGRYVGCYRDVNDEREFSFSKNLGQENSVTGCVQFCFKFGFMYAGTQFGIECWCGHKITYGRRVDDGSCKEMPCPGNKKENCGSFLIMAIYETGLGNPRYETKTRLIKDKPKNRPRIVFLLTLNGRAVRQVKRLLGAIYRPHHYYYIHVDERQIYLRTQLMLDTMNYKNIEFANWCMSTIWGGASLLSMHLKSMKDLILKKRNWTWDYILNLSESDFPVKSIELLENYLAFYNNSNFLRAHGKDTPKFSRKQGVEKIFVECDKHMWRVGDRFLPNGIRVDGGSDWFCLSKSFVSYMIEKPDDIFLDLRNYWQYSLLPSESFFHTLLANTRFCPTLVNNNLHVTNWKRSRGCRCQYKHLVDWCGCSPNIFTDMDRIIPLHMHPIYFARKFDPTINQKTILGAESLSGVHWENQNPSFNYFWLNDYSSFEGKNDVKEVFYSSLAKIHSRSNDVKLLNGTLLFIDDKFQGVIVEYVKKSKTYEVKFEKRWKWVEKGGRMGGDRLVKIQIGSDWDPKEELLRNWAGVIGQTTNIAVVHTWVEGDIPVKISLLLVQPDGVVAALKTETVDINAHNLVFDPKLEKPLKPGKWTFLLFANEKKVAQYAFVVLPLGLDSKINEVKVDNFFSKYLPSAFPFEESYNAILLTKADWSLKGFCILNGDTNLCKNEVWSTHFPDPKSTIDLMKENLFRRFSIDNKLDGKEI